MSKSAAETKKLFNPIDFEQLINDEIHQPAQYMGKELGTQNQDWHKNEVHWVLSYPELYEVGASNLGHIILYSILNKIPNQLCDRAYLPGPDLAKRLREQSVGLFGVESRQPLKNFDLIGFSLSYELGATNILEMLDLAEIDIYAKNRENLKLNDPHSSPLIFAGGPTATSNPEPYAYFFDFLALGDGEELLPEIGLIIQESKRLALKRTEALLYLSEIPGVYVPSLYQANPDYSSIEPLDKSSPKQIIRRVANPMPQYSMGLVPYVETVHDRLTIEIRRGCTRGCRFCQPGMLTRPARDVAPEEIVTAVETGMKKTGYSDFSLLSLSCSDYLSLPQVGVELRNKLGDKNITLQLPSQRIDRFDDNIAHILGGSRKAGLTFAPEAGSQRLRDIINKGLTNADLLNGIRKAMEHKYKKVKLYFMIGLPGETDEDIKDIAATCHWLQDECKDFGRLYLNLTISNFTPKPHTPFQWHSVSSLELQRRQELLKLEFQNLNLKHIKINFTDVRISTIENFLGRGDRRLAPVIETAWKSGAGMDAWFESQDRAYKAWSIAISKAGLQNKLRDIELGTWESVRKLTEDELIAFCSKPLPWDHIDTGINKQWLIKDLQNALAADTVPDCSFDKCSNCGVCGPELGHNNVIQPQEIPVREDTQSPHIDRKCRIRIKFAKTNPMHLISHLDLIRLLERTFRRSELPISYSGGFHPLPRLQIALALPLGVEGFGEWMDVDFYEEVDPKIIRNQLQRLLPKGINLLKAETILINKTSLSQNLSKAKWSFVITTNSNEEMNLNKWNQAIQNILNSQELIWIDTNKKGHRRERDFKPQLNSLKLKDAIINDKKTSNQKSISIELESSISPLGQSIKPIHVKYWLTNSLEATLSITDIQRNELILKKC
ncbi:TIGR03960 family B12-binding radical SAM protein [Prochlorococcus marinus]|uniref:TIGR03960 family B12-binding radical SAM protein n=1 Tax=Prochlorococcus marinus TaxID=1219 RepID=UPI0022B2D116|nr:TIGR03960 family B12-binding radical SAM protein [Prochlorococcus marinus]